MVFSFGPLGHMPGQVAGGSGHAHILHDGLRRWLSPDACVIRQATSVRFTPQCLPVAVCGKFASEFL
jgi:hypothetical protein